MSLLVSRVLQRNVNSRYLVVCLFSISLRLMSLFGCLWICLSPFFLFSCTHTHLQSCGPALCCLLPLSLSLHPFFCCMSPTLLLSHLLHASVLPYLSLLSSVTASIAPTSPSSPPTSDSIPSNHEAGPISDQLSSATKPEEQSAESDTRPRTQSHADAQQQQHTADVQSDSSRVDGVIEVFQNQLLLSKEQLEEALFSR